MNLVKIARAIIAARYFGAPFFFRLYVTRRCNMRCRMCSVWKHGDAAGEMGLDEIARVITEVGKTGVRYAVITGGEPFLRRDLPEIVSLLDRAGFLVRIQTNAGRQVTEDLFDRVVAASRGQVDLTVSLDSLNPALLDHICDSRGALESILRVLRMAVEKLPKGMVNANIVVSRLNIEEVPAIVRALDAMGVWSNPSPVNMPCPGAEEMLLQRYSEEMAFTPRDAGTIDRIYGELLRMKREGVRIGHSVKFMRGSAEFLKTGEKKWPACEAGLLYFSVFPDGSVYPCDELHPIGNALDGTFAAAFKSPEYRKQMDALHASCAGCYYGCWRESSDLVHSRAMLAERFGTFLRSFAPGYLSRKKRPGK